MLITAFYSCSTQRSPGTSSRGWVPKSGQAPSGDWTGILIINITSYPTRQPSHNWWSCVTCHPCFRFIVDFVETFQFSATFFSHCIQSLITWWSSMKSLSPEHFSLSCPIRLNHPFLSYIQYVASNGYYSAVNCFHKVFIVQVQSIGDPVSF